MRYIPNSPKERQEMLVELGLNSAPELFSSIPAEILLSRPLNTPSALSELELIERFELLARKNTGAQRISFIGAGAYSHYAPTIVDHLISRSEFFTAYTPYQPEVSQGTLQAIFEFQTLVCQLTGMDVANASMYDCSTALAEAVLMAGRVTGRKQVIVSEGIHPEYLQVINTYVRHAGIQIKSATLETETGLTTSSPDISDQNTAALVIQSPNFFGGVEDLKGAATQAHQAGALLIVAVSEAVSLGLLRPPGACGADIVVAEGQSLGIPLSFGGPYVGLFAVREKYARQLPGRLAGLAFDKNGRRGFVLTLATREQHIRREKATSNICTNEGLMALAATIYMTTMGRRGLQEVAWQCAQKGAYAARQISEIPGFSLPHRCSRFNEFVVRGPLPAPVVLDHLNRAHGITAGLDLSRLFPGRPNDFLICITEMHSRAQIDKLVEGLWSVKHFRETASSQ